jgi:hypothetical protein
LITETKKLEFMKKNIIKLIAILLLPAAFLASCKKDVADTFDQRFTGIYFEADSINYSFSVTPLEVNKFLLKVPVRIMGVPTASDRVFGAEIITDKTTAVEGTQYTIDGNLAISKDSIRGYIPVLINRGSLGNNDYSIRFKLVEKNGFTPVNKPLQEVIVVFNNRVEPPKWKDWQGKPTWPNSYLGVWNPLTYVKFIELFRALEQKAPETYKTMVSLYGPDLEHVDFGWPYDYQNTMNKYVLIPLYKYFMEENPGLGVKIPRPSGY